MFSIVSTPHLQRRHDDVKLNSVILSTVKKGMTLFEPPSNFDRVMHNVGPPSTGRAAWRMGALHFAKVRAGTHEVLDRAPEHEERVGGRWVHGLHGGEQPCAHASKRASATGVCDDELTLDGCSRMICPCLADSLQPPVHVSRGLLRNSEV